MKRTATVFGTIALTAILAIGLTACNSAQSMKSDEVTLEGWTSAFSEENFTNVRMEGETTSGVSGKAQGGKVDYSQTRRITAVIAGDYEYYKIETETSGKILGIDIADPQPVVEKYSAKKEDGTYTIYTKDASGNWIMEDSVVSVAADIIVGMIGTYANMYESYVFSKDRKGYVGAEDLDGTQEVLKFKDGKLAAIWLQSEKPDFDENGFTYAVRISGTSSVSFTYGGQSITLPQLTSA